MQFQSMQKRGGVSGKHCVFAGGLCLHAVQMRVWMFTWQQCTQHKQCTSAKQHDSTGQRYIHVIYIYMVCVLLGGIWVFAYTYIKMCGSGGVLLKMFYFYQKGRESDAL